MAVVKTFTEIVAWQKAHQLALGVYKATAKFPRFEEYGLSNQMRRCAVSVPSNIAEGFKRRSSKDSLHFYNIAEGSLEELKYQLLLAKDLNYLTKEEYLGLFCQSEETGKLLYSWGKCLKIT